MRPWPHGRHPKLTYEDHPRFGYYVYCASTGLWSQLRTRPDGRLLMLRCRERRPSDERLRLWAEVEERLPELEAAAFAAVPDPPVRPWRGQFDRAGLTLDEVMLEDDGLVEFFLSTPFGDEIGQWPIVTFADWAVRDAEWAT